MAACVDLIQRGYTGLEVRGNTLQFNPMLPAQIDILKANIHYCGHWLELEISSKKFRITALSGGAEPIRIIIKERVLHLRPGESIEV
ncbi:MAG TPA: glycosyl hydrolase family 65 protein [Desulfobacterales bacterium]|nr:glycosyl hydrolase family 65 protein [Desulfobacterales bacterium]